jgi:hypothetical protein
MNEQIKQLLEQNALKLIKLIENGIEQLPAVVNEIYTQVYLITGIHIAILLFSITVAIICVILGRRFKETGKESDEAIIGAYLFFGVVSAIIFIFVCLNDVYDILQVHYTPRLFLIHEIQHLFLK